MTAPARRTTFREVFAVAEFSALFASRVLSIVAETLRIVALSVLVYAATGSALLSAVAFGIGFLPQVVGGAFLTALSDRVRPRPLIVTGYLVQAGAAAVIALVPLPVFAILGLVAGVAVLTPVFGAAASGLVPTLLTGDRYVLGRSATNIATSGAQIAGLALGGAVLAIFTTRETLLVGAACQLLAAAVARCGLRDHPARAVRPVGGGSVFASTWAGNRRLLADPRVRGLLLVQWLPVSAATGAESLIVAYVAELGRDPAAAGVLLALIPIGMLVGDLVVGRFLHPLTRERLVLPLMFVLGVPLIWLVFEPGLTVAAALLFVSGLGFAYALGLQQWFLAAVPEQSRGLAFGLLGTGLMTCQGLSPIAAGALAGLSSAGVAMGVAGACTVVAATLLRDSARPGMIGR
jgi:predicted MFS family arabinose efflux permease